ncbi:CCDC90 family protein [Thauera aromatica]|uniref:CCDC90 family protein n=1 Tax=Thauera aromatica TaxID=59405 RepID=UPI001FFC90F2|nr:CCDC90 family protein [Thauera aromatica]MCK2097265.1 CCDC90 family protein [Thauera aromatica]
MSTVTFDTREFTRKLRDAGFDEKQAETVVRVLAESQEKLVTREHFDAKLEALELRLTIKLGSLIAAGIGIVAAILKLG